MSEDTLRERYDAAVEKLAAMLSLQVGEVHNFVGDVRDGAWGARRLRELLKGRALRAQLDCIVKISDEYQCFMKARAVEGAACR